MDNGGFGDIGRNLIILIPIIILILVNAFFRKRRAERTQPEIVISLLTEVSLNQQIVEAFAQQTKKFRTGSWQRNKNKLDFLEQELQFALAETFSLAEEFNREIAAAKKYKSSSYLIGIPVDNLRKPLAHSRQGLEEWLQTNSDQIMTSRRRGLFH